MKRKPVKHLPGKGKWFILGLVLISAIYLLGRSIHQSLPPQARKVHPLKRPVPAPLEWPSPPLPSSKPMVIGTKKKVQIAIIVDDLGNQYRPVHEIIWNDFPLTMAVLPFGPFTKRIAEEVLASGKDMILHLPMEPRGYPKKDPGEGALFISMTPEEILDQLEKAIQDLPGLKGVNNHMGSRFMEDEERVDVVIKEISRQGLFFVDSLTTNSSKGWRLARAYSLPLLLRDIYLDNDHDPECIRKRFRELIAIAKKRGWAIGICHPVPETISVLMEVLPNLEKEDVEVVPISYLAKGSS